MRFSKIKKGTKEYIQRFRAKKITNIIISSLLFLFGLSGIITITIFQEHGDIVRSYRFLTVNSTTFTSILSFIFVFLSIKEIRKGKQFKSDVLYYLRLVSMVTECVVAAVVIVGLLPCIPDDPKISNYDSIVMHIVVPLLSIVSFVLNDPPRKKINYFKLLHGAWGVVAYAAVIIPLVCTNVIAKIDIPYSFLEFSSQPVWYLVGFSIMVCTMCYAFSLGLARLNKIFSPIWFSRLTQKKKDTTLK